MVDTGPAVVAAERTRPIPGITSWGAPTLAVVVAAVVMAAGWRGADWPAQVFRIEMFRREGLTVWNNHWYGGHHSIGYSLILPPLGAFVGPGAVGLATAGIATACLQRLLLRIRPDRVAAAVGAALFGVSLGANLAVGRLPFQLGVTLALGALVCWERRWIWATVALAVASGLASPVAALFLGIVAGGAALARWRAPADLLRTGDVRGQGPIVAAAALGPVVLIAVVFPSGGSFPFAFGGVALSLLAVVAVWWVSEPADRELRGVLAVSGLAIVAAWLLPTPLGGNIARLPMFFALPLITVLAWSRRRAVVAVAAVVLVAWSWSAAEDAVLRARHDPTVDAAYFRPMIAAVRAEAGEVVRVEIPFTRRHWEAAHVAPVLPLARGWERQLDRERNPVFYEEDGLSALEYHVWLRENAVRFVALPSAELDPSALGEAALLEAGQPFLRPVWESHDWRVWEVLNAEALVSGDVEVVEIAADRILLDARSPGEVLLRVRFSPHWVAEGPSCVREDLDGGWTIVDVAEPGEVELTISPAALAGVSDATADACDTDEGVGAR